MVRIRLWLVWAALLLAVAALLAWGLGRRGEGLAHDGERLRARAERELHDASRAHDQLFTAFRIDREHAAALAAAYERIIIAGRVVERYDPEAYHQAMREALAERAARERGGTEAERLIGFAWWLLEEAPPRCRDADHALAIATRAVAMGDSLPPATRAAHLDTLALARFRTGDRAGALADERRALALLPPEEEDLRDALVRRLAHFAGEDSR